MLFVRLFQVEWCSSQAACVDSTELFPIHRYRYVRFYLNSIAVIASVCVLNGIGVYVYSYHILWRCIKWTRAPHTYARAHSGDTNTSVWLFIGYHMSCCENRWIGSRSTRPKKWASISASREKRIHAHQNSHLHSNRVVIVNKIVQRHESTCFWQAVNMKLGTLWVWLICILKEMTKCSLNGHF